MAKESHRRCDQLPVLHPDAAGIDVGASELFVAVGAEMNSATASGLLGHLNMQVCKHERPLVSERPL